MQATAHIEFIVAAYGAGVVVIVALIAWVMLDYRLQRPHSCRTGNDRSLATLRARFGGTSGE
jgi:heme exporter protein CcmD